MATVVMHAVVSVDGFIADENDDVGPLFEWYFNGDLPIVDDAAEERHAPFRIGRRSHEYVTSYWASIGATIQGRHLFDLTNGWEAEPPAGDHLLVVSHRPKPEGWHPEPDVPFFTDVAAAVDEARRRAGDRVVALCAGDRRRAGARARAGRRGRDGRRTRRVRRGEAVLRVARHPAPAGGPARRDPGRPGAAPAVSGPALREFHRPTDETPAA
jgi:dihydrofolate reductase